MVAEAAQQDGMATFLDGGAPSAWIPGHWQSRQTQHPSAPHPHIHTNSCRHHTLTRVKNNSLLDQARRSVVTQFLKHNLDYPKYSHHRDQTLPSVFTRWPTVPQPTLLSSDTCHTPPSPDTATLKSPLPQQPSLSCFHLLATECAVSTLQ